MGSDNSSVARSIKKHDVRRPNRESLFVDESEMILASSDSFSDNDLYSSLKKSHKKEIPQIILQKIAKYLELQK